MSIDETVNTDLKFALVPEWFIDSGVSDKAFRLYTVLAKYADNDDGTAYPGRSSIAKRMGCSRSSVDRALEELIALGAVTKQRRVIDRRYTSSLYTVYKAGPRPTGAATPTDATTPSPTHDATSSHGCSKELDQELDQSELLAAAPRETVKPKAPRPTDLMFDTMVRVCGINPATLTGSERGRINKALKELREVGATPQDIEGRASAYRKKYPDAAITPTALTGNWSALQTARQTTPVCDLCRQRLDNHDAEICVIVQNGGI